MLRPSGGAQEQRCVVAVVTCSLCIICLCVCYCLVGCFLCMACVLQVLAYMPALSEELPHDLALPGPLEAARAEALQQADGIAEAGRRHGKPHRSSPFVHTVHGIHELLLLLSN